LDPAFIDADTVVSMWSTDRGKEAKHLKQALYSILSMKRFDSESDRIIVSDLLVSDAFDLKTYFIKL